MTEKLCVFCEHFRFETTHYEGVSDVTMGDTYGGLSCGKSKFYEERPANADEYRVLILKAESCRRYKPAVTKDKK